ncbi:MAG: methyltransferase domain-containing protein [Alphaproteobacteria bacterium]|nr:methyltransferase domain-containing protein [Alphaproteobacteria bacterium]
MTESQRIIGDSRVKTARGLFWRRWVSNPRGIGAVAPSAPALTRRMAREVVLRDGEAVVELGPGTGTVTQALIKAGVPEDRLILVERDPEMHEYLRDRFPHATVIRGDAAELATVVPERWKGRVSTVVSSLPLLGFPMDSRARIADQVFDTLAEGGRLVQFTYSPFCPLRRVVRGIKSQRTGFAAFNLPPATIWRYTADPEGGKASARSRAN